MIRKGKQGESFNYAALISRDSFQAAALKGGAPTRPAALPELTSHRKPTKLELAGRAPEREEPHTERQSEQVCEEMTQGWKRATRSTGKTGPGAHTGLEQFKKSCDT